MSVQQQMQRWVDEQMFEEDVRAVLTMMRPNRQERLLGWSEYRTGGKHFRATISWDDEFERTGGTAERDDVWEVPNLAEVLETILIGTVKNQDELSAEQEYELYRSVVRDLYRRILEMRDCHE